MEQSTIDALVAVKRKLRTGLSSEVTIETIIDILLADDKAKEQRIKDEADSWLISRGLGDLIKPEI